jgi:hypothetical protein
MTAHRLAALLFSLLTGCGFAGEQQASDSATGDSGADDADQDGFVVGEDCDDADPGSHPGASEYCDGADNDCNGVVDDDALDTLSWYADLDGDGYGDPLDHRLSCRQPSGRVSDAQDCDDQNPEVHPGADESGDGVDNDCDGEVDEGAGSDGGTPDGGTEPHLGEVDLSSASDWWIGDEAGAAAGQAVAGGLDFTGDGRDDLLLAAPASTAGGQFYLVPGSYLGAHTGERLDEASSSGAVGFTSPSAGARLGAHLALFQDVDGDGVVDFAVGAPGFDDGAADTGVICLYLSSPDDFYYIATSAEGAGMGPVGDAGDTNGDGLSDILFGAPGLTNSRSGQGYAELLLGDRAGLVEVGTYWLGEAAADALGGTARGAGDLDGDGYAEAAVTGTGYPGGSRRGAAWITMGRSSWSGGQTALDDADHRLVGSQAGDGAGAALAGGADLDGDGYDDLALTAPGASSGAGVVYLFYGGSSWGTATHSGTLASADGTLLGEAAGDGAGGAVDLVEDFDDDGVADLLVGAPGHGGALPSQGAAYLMLGAGDAWTGAHSLADASIVWRGQAAQDQLGTSVAAAGDVDGDGHADLVLGAPGADDGGSAAGAIYLFLGF